MGSVQLAVQVSQPLIVDQPATDSFDDVVLVLVVDHRSLGVFTLGAYLRDASLEPIAGSARRVVLGGSLQLDVYVCDCVRYFRREIGISGFKVDFDCISLRQFDLQSGSYRIVREPSSDVRPRSARAIRESARARCCAIAIEEHFGRGFR